MRSAAPDLSDPVADPIPLAQCSGVSRTYGKGSTAVVAVHGATCVVCPGSRVALTGWSGSGKSTLLHLLSGLEQPTSGSVRWPALDASPRTTPGWLGMVYQGPSLIPSLDVVENVSLPLLLAGASVNDAQSRAKAALDDLGTGDLVNKLPDELSGGQAQRVAIARVLAGEARLILADEPTGQLDRRTAAQAVQLLVKTADRLGAALVVATHDITVAAQLSTRWRMHDGCLRTRDDSDGGEGQVW